MSLFPKHAFLYPVVYAFILYGGRFLVFACAAFFLSDPSRSKPLGRPHIPPPAGFNLALSIRRELGYSLLALLIFSLVNAFLVGYGLIGASLLYVKLTQYPMWWFWVSIPAMMLLHDTLFYWLHRAMHSRVLFEKMHRLHHESIYPTAFAAYSFSWLEATAEALIVTAIIYIIPVHPLAFLAFQTISTAYNVYGHCGREFYPQSIHDHWLGKWLNTSSLHAHHHLRGHGNYSFYFTFWDRAMGTLQASKA